ncbi:MAG: RNA polymerase sigma factor [Planctomycetota bacterium]
MASSSSQRPSIEIQHADNDRTDERLLADYRTGDRAALETLFARYHDDLVRFLYRLVGDRAGADDVLQETFLQVHLSADSFDTSRRFRPWLFTIAANKGRDLLRKRGRRRTLDLSAPVGSDGETTFIDLMEIDIPLPDDRMTVSDQSKLVQKAIDRMSPTLREILLLAYFQRLSYAQIADDLGVPLGTVKSRLHAAVASFAKHWTDVTKGDDDRDRSGS